MSVSGPPVDDGTSRTGQYVRNQSLLGAAMAVFLLAARAHEVLSGYTLGPLGPVALFVLLLSTCSLAGLYVFEDGRFVLAVAGPLSVAVGFLVALGVLVAVGWLALSPSALTILGVSVVTALTLGIAGAALGNAARTARRLGLL